MDTKLAREIAVLPTLRVNQLRQRYAEVFGETVNTTHKTWLVRRIAWRLQASAEGGLSERALRRAEKLANDADVRFSAIIRSRGNRAGNLPAFFSNFADRQNLVAPAFDPRNDFP